jgi:aminomethyltransferase
VPSSIKPQFLRLRSDSLETTDEASTTADDSVSSCSDVELFELPSVVGGTRVRKSCYFDATVRWGVRSFSVYNHMLLPMCYEGQEAECDALRNHVCLWDVAVERQLELKGPDAVKLAEMITPRAMGSMKVGDMRYAIITDENGGVMNDPVALRIADDCFWFSIADSDVSLWCKALVHCHKLRCSVTEAAVSPCAIQGPKSLPLMQELFGEWVADIKLFTFREVELLGARMLLSRSGWSPERGYELFLRDEAVGNRLFEHIMEVGQKYRIKPGVPNNIRRIEGGMLNFAWSGGDIGLHTNALELCLPMKWFKMDKPDGFIGQEAIERVLAEGGPQCLIVGLKVEGEPITDAFIRPWQVEAADGTVIGKATSFTYSSFMGVNLLIARLNKPFTEPETKVVVLAPSRKYDAVVSTLPFIKRVV